VTAEALLTSARAQDVAEAVAAKISREAAPERTHEQAAEAALRQATFDAEVAHRASLSALDAIGDETRDPKYRKALDKQATGLTKAGVAALDALDSLLEKLQTAKAHRSWLASPITGERLSRVIGYDAWLTEGTGFQKQNGEPGEARDLTRAVRAALAGGPRTPTNPAAEYGLPPGQLMSGPWGVAEPVHGYQDRMSNAAARLFEEEAAEALEAQTALVGD
jgi:hypothetical protein